MQYMLDHIVAFLVGGSILLIVFALMMRGQQASVGATQFSAAQQGMVSLAQMIEQDFKNIGAEYGGLEPSIINLDTASFDRKFFVFHGIADTMRVRLLGLSQVICYRWDLVDTVVVKQGETYTQIPTYQMQRLVSDDNTVGANTACDPGAAQVQGLSMSTITSLEITLLDAIGDTIRNQSEYGNVREVHVSASAASPLGAAEILNQARWKMAFRPVNLARQSY